MRLSLIVAMSRNRVIGRAGTLPWRLNADLRRFKRLTTGHPLIMGRKTFESIGRVLPERTSIIITRQLEFQPAGVLVAHSLDEAIQLAGDSDEAFIIGGAQIYREALSRVDRMYITAVDADLPGDTFFPTYDDSQWQLVERADQPLDDKNSLACRFLVYDRVGRIFNPSMKGNPQPDGTD